MKNIEISVNDFVCLHCGRDCKQVANSNLARGFTDDSSSWFCSEYCEKKEMLSNSFKHLAPDMYDVVE